MEESITTTISTEDGFWKVFKKNFFVLVSAGLTAILTCSAFYYNTINSSNGHTNDIFTLKERVNEIEKTYKEPVVESKLNKQQLDDIQRQLDELKVNVNKIDNKVENKFEGVDEKFDKVFEILFTIQNNTKKK